MLEYTKKNFKLKLANSNNYKEERNKIIFEKALRSTFLNPSTKSSINNYDEDENIPSFFDWKKRFINNQRIINSDKNLDIKRPFEYISILSKTNRENKSIEDYDTLNKLMQIQKYKNELYNDYTQIPRFNKSKKVEVILKKVRFHDLLWKKNKNKEQKSLKKTNENKKVNNASLLNYFLPIERVLFQKNNNFTKRNSNKKILISQSQNTTNNKTPKVDIKINNKRRVVNIKSSLPLLNKYDYKNKTQNEFFIDKLDKTKESHLDNEEISIKPKLQKEISLLNIHSYKKLINYNMISTPGSNNGKTKKNQDSYFIIPKLNNCEEIKIFGIFDGHGEKGDILSNEINNFFLNYYNNLFNDGTITENENENNLKKNIFIIKNINSKRHFNNIYFSNKLKDKNINLSEKFKLQNLSNKLKEKSNKIKNIYNKLTSNEYSEIFSSYKKLEELLRSKYSNSNFCHLSGSTALILFVFNSKNFNKIISSNLGDSKIILISEKNKIKELNSLHTLDNSEEKNRIIKNGGIIKRLNVGPLRIWFKNKNYPGLSITRSFGDFESDSLGIISVPDIKEYDLEEEQIKILIFGTDGFWKFLTNEKVMNIVLPYYEHNDAEGATQKVREMANNLWNIKNPKGIADITVFVLFFK